MRHSLIVLSLIVLGIAPVGCGGGASDQTAAATSVAVEPVTLHHVSGRVSASGFVLAGTTIRTGAWTTYFDDESGQRQWDGHYRDGAVDGGKPWQEWNLDGSIRFDSSDR